MNRNVVSWGIPVCAASMALACSGKPTREAERATSSELTANVASLRPVVPPLPAEIDIRPANGATFAQETEDLSVDFTGFFPTAGQSIDIQVLSDPSAAITETSWTTIATTTTATTPTNFNDPAPIFRWSVSAVPAPAGTSRWPSGGLLRWRAVATDATGTRTALPFFDSSAGSCVAGVAGQSWKAVLAACKSPFSADFGAPAAGQVRAAALVSVDSDPESAASFDFGFAPDFLSRKGEILTGETDAYYDLVEAPRSLREFQDRFGFFGQNEVAAIYFNLGDLGIGREMHCATFDDGGGGGTACYVRNYGVDDQGQPLFSGPPGPALRDAIAGVDSFATVAMVKFGSTYSPPEGNDVQFFVFNGQDQLVNQAQLDNIASNEAIPNNCLNCHGGTYDRASATVVGSTFLPFDPNSLLFPADGPFSFAAQAESIRQLNALVKQAGPPPPVAQFIDGLYQNAVDADGAGAALDLDWIPTGWAKDAESKTLYREVVRPYCRTCHMSQTGDFAFMRVEDFKAESAKTALSVCQNTDMPLAEATLGQFWSSGARAYVVNALGLSTPCAPLQAGAAGQP